MNDTNNKLLDAIIDLGLAVKELRTEVKSINTRLEKLEKGFDKLEKQQAKTNLALSEMRLSFIHYADKLDSVIDHEKRISKLEQIVLKK